MPTHGTKRLNLGKEEIFHHSYGWVSVREFYDLMSELKDDSETDPQLEPEYMSRQSGESFEHYRSRIKEIHEYPDEE